MRTVALASLLLAATLAYADPPAAEPAMTAGDLQQLCAGSDHVSRNACRIYILGVTQGIPVGMQLGAGKGDARVCALGSVSAEQLEQKVRSRLDAELARKPEAGTRPAAEFIGRLLAPDYTCQATR